MDKVLGFFKKKKEGNLLNTKLVLIFDLRKYLNSRNTSWRLLVILNLVLRILNHFLLNCDFLKDLFGHQLLLRTCKILRFLSLLLQKISCIKNAVYQLNSYTILKLSFQFTCLYCKLSIESNCRPRTSLCKFILLSLIR